MIVKSKDGGFVRMEDIATVELAAQSTDASVAFNGEHAIFIGVQATPQGNPLTLVKGVRALFPELERNLPPSMKMKVAYDSTKFIQSSIDEVEKTLGEAVLIVVVVIFLFLASFRSVIIPVVTIPLSLIGVCILMLAAGFSFNLLTLLAMVLAIGLVVDDAIVVVENIHRHLEEGKPPVQASLKGAREIVGPVISMTITLAAVYAPIGFLGGVTGTLFREFAFTLAGSVIVSGVIALTLSPMMCSVFLKNAEEGRFAKLVNRVFGAMTRWYGRKLDRSLDYRPITGLFAVTILGLVGFLYMHTSKELAPRGRPGHRVRGDQGAEIRQHRLHRLLRREDRQGVREVSRDRPALRPERHHTVRRAASPACCSSRGMSASASSQQAEAAGAGGAVEDRGRQRLRVQPAAAARRSRRSAGADGDQLDRPDSRRSIEQMAKLKDAARKSGLFIVSDSDLDFNQPVVRVKIDRSKASDLGITMQSVGGALATLLGGNYVNRFNLEGRSYQVIPQVPRANRLVAGVARQLLRPGHDRAARAAVDRGFG